MIIKNDMLVLLQKLPPLEPIEEAMRGSGIIIRRANPWEISVVREFILHEFSPGWADEISVAYSRQPPSVFIALRDGRVVGFAGYECTARGFFGPTGVAQSQRGKGVGKALLIAALHGLKELGYVYGIIGSANDPKFYAKAVGAIEIENSAPGIYANPLTRS